MQTSRFFLYWSPPCLWAGFIFYLSHQSNPPGADLGPDFVGHILLYGVLAVTLLWAVTKGLQDRVTLRRVLIVWALAILYGVFDELHQSMVPLRDPSMKDLISNLAGSGLALSVSAPLLRYLRGKWKWIPE